MDVVLAIVVAIVFTAALLLSLWFLQRASAWLWVLRRGITLSEAMQRVREGKGKLILNLTQGYAGVLWRWSAAPLEGDDFDEEARAQVAMELGHAKPVRVLRRKVADRTLSGEGMADKIVLVRNKALIDIDP